MFNFYWNVSNNKEEDNPDLTELMQQLDNLLVDWQNFFILYSQFAPPPNENKKQIQAWFKELEQQHQKCVKLFKESAGIQTNDNTPPPEMMEFLQHIQKESKRVEPKEDEEDNLSMYG